MNMVTQLMELSWIKYIWQPVRFLLHVFQKILAEAFISQNITLLKVLH